MGDLEPGRSAEGPRTVAHRVDKLRFPGLPRRTSRCFQSGTLPQMQRTSVYRFLCEHDFLILWDRHPGVQLLDSIFKKLPNRLSEWPSVPRAAPDSPGSPCPCVSPSASGQEHSRASLQFYFAFLWQLEVLNIFPGAHGATVNLW